jgi:hypothetical protein
VYNAQVTDSTVRFYLNTYDRSSDVYNAGTYFKDSADVWHDDHPQNTSFRFTLAPGWNEITIQAADIGADYLTYVDETIEEADAGAGKINEIMAEGNEEATFFDKLSDAFKTAISDVNDLLAYFKNVVKKCVNSVAVMIVTTFVLPMLVMLLFRWLLTELFALHLPAPKVSIKLPKELKNKFRKETDLIEVVNDDER